MSLVPRKVRWEGGWGGGMQKGGDYKMLSTGGLGAGGGGGYRIKIDQ